MENRDQYEDLLIKHLLNELTGKEEAFVIEWINSSEENTQCFNVLKNTWRLTSLKNTPGAINVNHEWRQLEQKISFKEIEDEQDIAEVIEIGIDETRNKNARIYKIIISTAIAASLIWVMGLAGLFDNNNNKATEVAEVKVTKKSSSAFSSLRHELNTSGKLRKLVLQDGTEVTLSDKSEISFYEPFIDDRRDIKLKGKANFKVAKDKIRPFTVFSGSLSTTALGTRFTVTAFENQNFIIVRLFEGKVVVKPGNKVTQNVVNNYYLLAGQELIYNNENNIAKVRRFGANALITKRPEKEKPVIDNLTIPENGTGSWFMFNNQPLSFVFDELQNMYDVDIRYSKKDISKIYFIGKFDRSESFENIIKQIADLNNLKILKKDNTFIITK
ncbi:MAG: anti-sigma factor [Segetibacter sp.]|nr:anti-sigma factor [Segetibacter sp.]